MACFVRGVIHGCVGLRERRGVRFACMRWSGERVCMCSYCCVCVHFARAYNAHSVCKQNDVLGPARVAAEAVRAGDHDREGPHARTRVVVGGILRGRGDGESSAQVVSVFIATALPAFLDIGCVRVRTRSSKQLIHAPTWVRAATASCSASSIRAAGRELPAQIRYRSSVPDRVEIMNPHPFVGLTCVTSIFCICICISLG